ncbi:barbiturase [Noviherbaspirillum suwonense]|uniref:Cyclic amide hydrolase n=2 Tax=Noviherbaspirillum suwonense TaxID=1224511 RepID=A0ABY1Q7B8_9BURK|nr:barbiturase [Noviherbaspirillum suwonense]
MAHPGDLSELDVRIRNGAIRADRIVAVIGKTEGNGGVNDFTRGYFTQSLMHLLSTHLDASPAELAARIPCILSGGTEGVLSPHYVVFCRCEDDDNDAEDGGALAIGIAFSSPTATGEIGRAVHARQVADAVRAAMRDAGIAHVDDVHFVQIKTPCITVARAEAARAQGVEPVSGDPNRAMAYARAAGALGVALALGEVEEGAVTDAAMLADMALYSERASVSSGVEISCNEVIVLGNSPHWTGPYRIAHRAMKDALDIGAVVGALADLGLDAAPQLDETALARIAGVFVKCEPQRQGRVRASRHTMLDDTDINAQRHVRGAVGGLVAGVIGDGRIFVSGGAEHQGPDGGGLIAVIAGRPQP